VPHLSEVDGDRDRLRDAHPFAALRRVHAAGRAVQVQPMTSPVDDRMLRLVRTQEIAAENHIGDVSAKDIAWLISEVRNLAAHLEWYADPRNYAKRAEGATFATLVQADGGARARAGLRLPPRKEEG
jgi:hypothetical protein